MARLSLALLGPLHVTLDGQSVSGFESNKVRALLLYLAVEAARPQHRSALAALLWPEQPEAIARSNLRQALANLRHTIADHQTQPPVLLITRETVQFNAASDHWLDVAAFSGLLAACASHTHRQIEYCKPCIQRLEQAVALYQGSFLAQFSVSDSLAFEEWAILQRERLHQLALDALAHLAAYHERRGAYDQAHRYAARQLELEPWSEEAHRRLMRALYRNGERAEALAQYERCQQVLADELGVEPEQETVALYEQLKHGRLAGQHVGPVGGPSSHSTDEAAAHPLPAQLTSFVGREEELAALGERLAHPNCRLITIVGPGGIGKTRLALQVAAEQAEMFPHGVVFVPLAALSGTEFLAPAIVAALAMPTHSSHDVQDQLFAYLRDRELLLVLDSFEAVLAGAELVAEILQRARGVTLLITTRERLALQGEWLFDIEGLQYPIDEGCVGIEQYSAVQLFAQRAAQAQRRFALVGGAAQAVVRICQLVEGLPLAIELAAATVRDRACAEIAAAIETNIRVLVTPLRDVPERHRSMWSVFEYSWSQLSREQRRVLRRLSVFRGGFSETAAAQVADAAPALLAGLVDKSLLRKGVTGRYDMHELLRQYATHKLRTVEGLAHTRRAHLDYFVQLAETAEPQLTGAEQATWLDRLEEENSNIRAALSWALEGDAVERAARLASALWRFWGTRGYLAEGRSWLDRVLMPGLQLATATRAKALKGAGVLAWSQGDYARAVALCEQGLALYQEVGDNDGVATCLQYLGSLALHQGDYPRSAALLEASLNLRRRLGDRWGIAVSLANLGALAGRQGNSTQAEQLYEESLVLLRELGDEERIAVMLDNLGAVARDRGDLVRARTLYEEGLALLYRLNNKWNIPTCLNNLGRIALDEDDPARAQARYSESLLLLRELGDKEGLAVCFEGLASVASGRGRSEQAARLYGAAERIREVIGSPHTAIARAAYDQAVAKTRAQQTETIFTATWAEGRALSLEQAIAYALAVGQEDI